MGRKYETKVIKLTDDELRRQLAALERTHRMTSEQFLERYNAGELEFIDELRGYTRWAALLDIAAKAGVSVSAGVRN
jgi:hypothetical protein